MDLKHTILIVEDDADLLSILIRTFEPQYQVESAVDGQEALDKILQNPPEFILLDLMLPKVDGFEVLAQVRKNSSPAIAHIPVVVLSNLFSDKDILRAENLVIDEYFVKAHTSLDDVVSKVGEILSKR